MNDLSLCAEDHIWLEVIAEEFDDDVAMRANCTRHECGIGYDHLGAHTCKHCGAKYLRRDWA
jgi:hypothetical protein